MEATRESSFAVSGFASVEQDILKINELDYSSCKSLQDFINQLTTAKEHLEAQSVYLPQSYYVVQLLRGLGQPFQSWASEVRREEQSIKRNEAQSNTNRGSVLTAGERKKSHRLIRINRKLGKCHVRWRCQTHKTDKHGWPDCSENPNSKNYKGNKTKNDKSKEADGPQPAATMAASVGQARDDKNSC